MSGILGIINLDGSPVDQELLRRMTDFMAYRGPDVQDIWAAGHVGFGHAMLRTTDESLREHQPFSLDGEVWITADARVDGRAELTEKLQSHTQSDLKGATDALLILHAYLAWGEDCVKHLIGDFAFAIWDGRTGQLFCARDHFGVKPFYYARKKNCLIFCSSPNPLRIHPLVSSALNGFTIADFLLFDLNLEPSRSAFADIQRIPPAHTLKLSEQALSIERYWTLPIEDEIKYKKKQDYVDRFNELMLNAVRDRVRTNRAATLLSGGMDSTTVAATACNLVKKEASHCDLKAFTYVYNRLMPDAERHYSSLAAQKLGIAINYTVSDDYTLYQPRAQRDVCPSEIINEPLRALFCDFVQAVTKHSRVALTGDGGDALLYPTDNYLEKALRSLRFGELVRDTSYFVYQHGRIPPLGFRTLAKRCLGLSNSYFSGSYPTWLNPSFEAGFALKQRWQEHNRLREPAHPRRNLTYESLRHPMWTQLFANYDPDVTGSATEFRYPFFDLRVVKFLLNIPSLPWCYEKSLLRVAMRDKLPEEITRRRKAVIVRDPILARVERSDWQLNDYFRPLNRLLDYINPQNISKADWLRKKVEVWMHVRPLSLNYWLENFSD